MRSCFLVMAASIGALVGADTVHADTSIYEPYAISTLAGAAGTAGAANGTGAAAEFNQPWGVAVASNGTVYVADALNHTIRKITSAGVVTLLAGTPGTSGFADSPGALFARPTGVAVDAAGNVYVADYNNQRIRKITAAGVVSTLAGSATGLVGTNDGTGAAAEFHNPFGVALNSTATLLYVSDQNNQTIRQITLPGGVVTTYAGISGGGYSNGPKASALFNTPKGIAVDSAGNVYVADTGNMVVRKISGGVVSTLAGDPATAFLAGYNDGAGSSARFSELAAFSPFGGPCGIAVDSDGYVYVTDQGNPASLRGHTLRKITPGGSVTTLAGTVSTPGAANGTGAGAGFRFPGGVAVDGAGKLYVADTLNHTIRVGSVLTPCVAGVTWTPREIDRHWFDVASSADGTKLVAVDFGGMIYTSTNSGATWTARESNRNWRCVASSADGSKLVATGNDSMIYTSTDSGVTWTARESIRQWQCVASSADGSKLVAGVAFGQIYISTDFGVTWTARDSNRLWYSVASSDDGSRLVAGSNGHIYTSTDFGMNWTPRDSIRIWISVASSADGIKLIAADLIGQLYTSTDSGVNWTARQNNQSWYDVASSADGTKLVALVDNGLIYISTDSGGTWTPRASSRTWRAVASSADGEKLAACVLGGKIYTSACAGPPVIYGGLDHLPLGDASVGKLGDDLIVGNLGSSGLDGIEIDLGPPADKTLNLHYEVPAGNGTMTFTGLGYVGGEPGQPISTCTVVHQGAEETFSFDFSSIGASTYTMQIYSGKDLVYERAGNSGMGYRKEKFVFQELPRDDWHLGFYYGENLEYYSPSYVTKTSASIVAHQVEGGPTVMGDRVVIIPENPMTIVEALSGGRIQVGGAIPEIKIVQEYTQLNHGGLPHQTLGDARLTPLSVDTTDPVGYNRLAISNLGSSGQGGFMVILSDIPVFAKRPPCTDFAMQWDKVDADGMLPNGAVLKFGSWPYIGPFYPYPGVPPGVMALVQVAKEGTGSHLITASAFPYIGRTVRAFHMGMLVAEVSGQTGPEVARSTTFNTSFACHRSPASVSLGFAPATSVSIGGGMPVACDQLFIMPDTPAAMGFPTAVQITAAHIPALTIVTENVFPFVLNATRLPNAMGPAGTTLSIHWWGSGRLKESGDLMNWTDVPGATASPFLIFSNDSKHQYIGTVTLVK